MSTRQSLDELMRLIKERKNQTQQTQNPLNGQDREDVEEETLSEYERLKKERETRDP